MKTIGLLGGMSWESTITYYRQINLRIKQQLGGLHSAKIILYSVDFAQIEALQRSGDWDKAGELLADAALKLQTAGADCLVLCTNTMHKVADSIAAAVPIPLLHIADATAAAIQGPMLQKIIGVFALIIALQMALDLKPKASRSIPGKAGLTAAGSVIGWASAIFGIGGGSLTVPDGAVQWQWPLPT